MDEVTRILVFTTIFTLSVAILLLVSFNTNRKRQLQHKKQLLEQEYKTREEALLQVSRDLHDDIGSSLSGINMLSQLAQEQFAQPGNGNTKELMQKINIYITEVIEKVSDMAWLLKPNQESLSILIKKLKVYATESASSKNVLLHFDNNSEIAGRELTIQERKTIYLVSKEAINNAIKYSSCKNIFYNIDLTGEKVKLMVKDDGKGFSVSETINGNGLANMKGRAAEIGGNLNIQSRQTEGTIITLEF
jgi:signal transduction histidine kinase